METKKRKNILVIIPAWNEEKNITRVLNDVLRSSREFDVLIIDDGSFDNTSGVSRLEDVELIQHPFNIGIGASMQTGYRFALNHGYEYVVRLDSDGQHIPKFIKDILLPVLHGEADISIGSRFLSKSSFRSSVFRLCGIIIITFFLEIITGKKITDPTSGFYAMNKKAFEFFAEHCAEDYPEPEILMHHRNFRIKEVPVEMLKRQIGASSITPLKSIYYMYKVLFSIFVSIFRKE